MNYKVCTKCDTNLPATTEFFHVQKRGLYNLKSNCKKCTTKYNKSKWIIVPKKTEKTCSHCKVTFPLTNEYFYTKTTKKGTIINGKPLSKDCISFRSVCKKCLRRRGFRGSSNSKSNPIPGDGYGSTFT